MGDLTTSTRAMPPPPCTSVFRASSLAAVTSLVWSTSDSPFSAAAARTCWRTRTTSSPDWIGSSSIRTDFPFRISRPFSALSAVRTPLSDSPSSVSVIATAGRMPTMTVSASNSREIDPIMVSIRPMNESTISTAVMSMITPCAPVADKLVGQVLLEAHDALVLQVDLDGDEQRLPDLEDRHPLH